MEKDPPFPFTPVPFQIGSCLASETSVRLWIPCFFNYLLDLLDQCKIKLKVSMPRNTVAAQTVSEVQLPSAFTVRVECTLSKVPRTWAAPERSVTVCLPRWLMERVIQGKFLCDLSAPPGNQVSTGELLKRLISGAEQNRAEKSFVGTTVRMWLAHWQEPC